MYLSCLASLVPRITVVIRRAFPLACRYSIEVVEARRRRSERDPARRRTRPTPAVSRVRRGGQEGKAGPDCEGGRRRERVNNLHSDESIVLRRGARDRSNYGTPPCRGFDRAALLADSPRAFSGTSPTTTTTSSTITTTTITTFAHCSNSRRPRLSCRSP